MTYEKLPGVFPILEIGDFALRRIELSDGDDLFTYISDPDVVRFMRPETRTRNQIDDAIRDFQSAFAAKTGIRWAIATKDTNRIIGDLGFRIDPLNLIAPIAYRLTPAYWGRGIGTEAVREVVSFAFDVLELNRVEATVNVANERSYRLLERLDFRREGLLRQYRFARGEFYDSYMYALLSGDPRPSISVW